MPRFSSCFAVFLIAAVLFLPASLKAENPDNIFNFAQHLKQQREFYRAVTEFERFRFLFPDSPRSEAALNQIIDCYFQAEQYEKASKACELYLDSYPESPERKQVLLRLVECFYQTEKYGEGAGELEFFLADHANDPLKPEALKLLGFIQLKDKKWERAGHAFYQLADLKESALSKPAQLAASDLEAVGKMPRRSPFFSGVLSALIPGAGQLYSGRMGDALASLSVNGLFTYVTVISFQEKKYVLGGFLALVELGWYSGNIYSAVNAAHKFNHKQEEKFIKRINARFLPHLSWRERGSHGLSLVITF